MEKLKTALSSAPALKPLIYTPEVDGFVGEIVLVVDACGLGFGAILQQEDRENRRHPVRYERGLWTPAETRYDAVKLECRGLLPAQKIFCYYLYRVQFLIENDARTLVRQLNQPASDLPGAIVARRQAYIRLLSFDIKHVGGETQGSRRLVASPTYGGRVERAGGRRRRGSAEVGRVRRRRTGHYVGEHGGGGSL